MKYQKNIQITYDEFEAGFEFDSTRLALIAAAKQTVTDAYAPYSKFNVGAAVRLSSGKVVIGNNQENLAYPSGLCAERVALFSAGAQFPYEKVTHLAIACKGDFLEPEAIFSPCGGCRQVMAEVVKRQGETFELIICNPNGSTLIFSNVADLLPLLFGE